MKRYRAIFRGIFIEVVGDPGDFWWGVACIVALAIVVTIVIVAK